MTIIDLNEQCNYLLKEIEKNCRKAAMTRSQIERLRMEKQETVFRTPSVSNDTFVKCEKDNEREAFEDEIEYYLSDYRSLELPISNDDIQTILPKRSNYHFQDILLRLQAESIREIKEIEEIMMESNHLTTSELLEYRQLLDIEKLKIETLRECLVQKDDSSFVEEEKNQLVLVPTPSFNVRIIDDLEHIPSEYYPNFYELIQSIVDGSFKGVKRFKNNRYLIGISEVKAFKIRVIFTRLGPNTYALITAFMKKSDNDKLYQESLQNKVSEYRKIESDLKKNLSNEEFLLENDKAVEEMFALLRGEKEEKRGILI